MRETSSRRPTFHATFFLAIDIEKKVAEKLQTNCRKVALAVLPSTNYFLQLFSTLCLRSQEPTPPFDRCRLESPCEDCWRSWTAIPVHLLDRHRHTRVERWTEICVHLFRLWVVKNTFLFTLRMIRKDEQGLLFTFWSVSSLLTQKMNVLHCSSSSRLSRDETRNAIIHSWRSIVYEY